MRLDLNHEPRSDFLPERRYAREPVRIYASGYAGEFPLIIEMLDMSARGFRAIIDPPLAMGAEITVSLTRLSERKATVRWQSDRVCGCEFADPLGSNDVVVL